jgi:hypothetical protein
MRPTALSPGEVKPVRAVGVKLPPAAIWSRRHSVIRSSMALMSVRK